MNIVVDEDLKAYIDPLTSDEHDALERSLLAEGCRDALVLWGDVLVDGHNRYGICQKHNIPFQTLQSGLFKTIEDVHLWMIDQHLGLRSVSDFQRGVLALRKREILADRKRSATALSQPGDADPTEPSTGPVDDSVPPGEPLRNREDIAKAARLSSSQVVLIEKIQKHATPEVVAAVKAGTISINAAAAVSTLPEEDQVAAALGGREQLRQAARRVREIKKGARPEESEPSMQDTVGILRARIVELETENSTLRKQLEALTA